jgi:hypothetical protein
MVAMMAREGDLQLNVDSESEWGFHIPHIHKVLIC